MRVVVKGRKGVRYPLRKKAKKRTHSDFMEKTDPDHYAGDTPLRSLEGLEMPTDVVVVGNS